ncbi:MAG: hypothetical protein COU67_02960 [Candidatus Pacebacteria bacterium CG10_big_fil_rev_8_21_14_0_10_44_54]|nr:MAG: hypothetical protein COU67_02960 [Candidatus Pacebacteria bacterium CG10_big_fil_rev_8_21_14_0_10_44_54]
MVLLLMSKIEWVALLFIVGVVILCWLLFFGAALFGYGLGTFLSVIFTTAVIFLAIKKTSHLVQATKPEYQLLIFVLAWGVLFLGLLQTRMLEQKSEGWYSGGATWGDLALHTSFISKFSIQKTFDLTSSIYAQQETHYPLLYDFFTAQLVRQGVTVRGALIYSTLTLLLASLVLFYKIVFSLTKQLEGVWIACCLFCFNGGFGFYYFWQDFRANKLLFNYSHIAEREIHFSNTITDMFLPQRGIVLGFALALVVLRLWQVAKNNRSIWLSTSVLIGLTPLIHVHTFLILLGCLTWVQLVRLQQKKTTFVQAVLLLLPAVVLGTFQLIWMGIGEQSGQFIKVIHGWMEPTGPLSIFWLKNLGLELFFLLIGNLLVFWGVKQKTVLHHLIPPLVLVFLLGNLLSFQPHIYDNIKLFFYTHLITAIFTTVVLLKITRKSRMLAAVIFILLVLSGVISVIRESKSSYLLAANEDLLFAKQVRTNTTDSDIFLTADSHYHPIPMLAGRSTVLGYRGWLWTHGVAYSQTEAEVQKIYAGAHNAHELLKKYNISYVVIGNQERQQFTINENYFYQNFAVVLQEKNRVVFAVR